ncbi:MAG: response regulator [Longimicrobiales bacterium]
MVDRRDIDILLVEDNPGDADLIVAYLEPHSHLEARVHWVESVDEAGRVLAGETPIDVILLDLTLPDSEGIETLESVRAMTARLPIIVLTGMQDDDLVWAAIQKGADDYLPKDSLTTGLLVRSVRYALDRAAAAESLREQEERYRTLFETMTQGVAYVNADGEFISANPAARRIMGLTAAQMEGRMAEDPAWRAAGFDGRPLPPHEHPTSIALRTGEPVYDRLMAIHNPVEDRTRWIRVDAHPQFRPGDDEPYQVYAAFADVTEQVQSERALRRKDAILEAVGEASEQLLTAGDLDDTIPDVLRALGQATEIATVDLWEIPAAPDGSSRPEPTLRYRWSGAEAKRSETGAVDPIPTGERWLERLEAGEAVHGTRQELSGAEWRTLEKQGVQAVALLPVIVRGTLWGCLGFADRHRDHAWSDPELDALGAAAATLGAAMQHREDQELLRRRDEQLLQTKKLEAVGRLAGGIAHDFNNLLTAVTGRAGFIAEALPDGSKLSDEVDAIVQAADRGSRLTRQLLAFSQHKVVEEQVLDPGTAALAMRPLLRPLIEENIVLDVTVEDGCPDVRMDPSQLEQIFMNLLINARDAVNHEGGRVRVTVQALELEQVGEPMLPDRPPAGHYARIEVADNGIGMNLETREHAFEPFFTTKDTGEGTGLGLTTVYGIVEAVGGYIGVESEAGQGTRFTILLPASERGERERAEPTVSEAAERVEGASGTVLVVEDEDAVRAVAVRTLEREGYGVIEAPDGQAALELVERDWLTPDLLLSDVVMPRVGGTALAMKLRERLPELRVILTSGYTEDELVQEGVDSESVSFLAKPYTPEELRRMVARALLG